MRIRRDYSEKQQRLVIETLALLDCDQRDKSADSPNAGLISPLPIASHAERQATKSSHKLLYCRTVARLADGTAFLQYAMTVTVTRASFFQVALQPSDRCTHARCACLLPKRVRPTLGANLPSEGQQAQITVAYTVAYPHPKSPLLSGGCYSRPRIEQASEPPAPTRRYNAGWLSWRRPDVPTKVQLRWIVMVFFSVQIQIQSGVLAVLCISCTSTQVGQ